MNLEVILNRIKVGNIVHLFINQHFCQWSVFPEQGHRQYMIKILILIFIVLNRDFSVRLWLRVNNFILKRVLRKALLLKNNWFDAKQFPV